MQERREAWGHPGGLEDGGKSTGHVSWMMEGLHASQSRLAVILGLGKSLSGLKRWGFGGINLAEGVDQGRARKAYEQTWQL